MLGIYLGSMMVAGGVFSLIDMLAGESIGPLVTQTAAMTTAAVSSLMCSRPVLALDWRMAIRRAGGRLPRAAWVPVLIVFAAGYPLVIQIALLTHRILPMPEFMSELFEGFFDTRDQPITALLLLTIIAPLTEEFVCRGWLMPAALKKWGSVSAVVFTAVVFGLIHLNPWQFFYAVYLGGWLGWIYLQTRSVWPCVAGHAVNNGLAWLWSLLEQGGAETSGSHPDAPQLLSWSLVTVSGVGVIISAAWLRRIMIANRRAATTAECVPVPPLVQ